MDEDEEEAIQVDDADTWLAYLKDKSLAKLFWISFSSHCSDEEAAMLKNIIMKGHSDGDPATAVMKSKITDFSRVYLQEVVRRQLRKKGSYTGRMTHIKGDSKPCLMIGG